MLIKSGEVRMLHGNVPLMLLRGYNHIFWNLGSVLMRRSAIVPESPGYMSGKIALHTNIPRISRIDCLDSG